jgi:hypothetical protein
MDTMVRRVMVQPELLASPPVFVDVGASGALYPEWKILAPYSVCVAFDADERDFTVSQSEDKGWKKLYLLNRLVAARAADEVDFYLTRSPHCSSSLQPASEALKPWAFSLLFEVENVVKLPAANLAEVLAAIGVDYIDWFKTDSQGTDLRIFAALPRDVMLKVIAAEFEPGIIDAYVGEDKLHHLMAYMEELPFWIARMCILGSQRIWQEDMAGMSELQRRSLNLRMAPGWCEITYLNTLNGAGLTCREYLLSWVFSSIKGEHGFALGVARVGLERFQNPFFAELYDYSLKSLLPDRSGFAAKVVRRLGRFHKRGP